MELCQCRWGGGVEWVDGRREKEELLERVGNGRTFLDRAFSVLVASMPLRDSGFFDACLSYLI